MTACGSLKAPLCWLETIGEESAGAVLLHGSDEPAYPEVLKSWAGRTKLPPDLFFAAREPRGRGENAVLLPADLGHR